MNLGGKEEEVFCCWLVSKTGVLEICIKVRVCLAVDVRCLLLLLVLVAAKSQFYRFKVPSVVDMPFGHSYGPM